jgi:hypothetical protein
MVDEVEEVLQLALIPPLEPRAAGESKPKPSYPGKPRPKPIVV